MTRLLPRAACAAAFAVAFSALAAAPGAASAQTTINAIAVARQPGNPQLFLDSATQTRVAGAHTAADAAVGTGQISEGVGAGAFTDPGHFELDAHTILASGFTRDHTISAGFAGITSGDQLTLNSTAGAGQLVTLHKTLAIEAVIDFVTGGQSGDRGDPNGDFDGEMDSTLKISGTGIGPGKFGGDVFEITNEHFGRAGLVRDHRTPAQTVDFTFNFILGQETNLFLDMSLTTSTELDDRDGSFFGSLFNEKFFNIDWQDGGTLTDAATGAAVCGVSGQSASGFDYLRGVSSAPCQQGGGGGEGGGAGVPEPATWTLMIAGFGLAGAGLRRRRAVGV